MESRGAKFLIISILDIGGRSFGTNVIDAAMAFWLGKMPQDSFTDDYVKTIMDGDIKYRVVYF